LANEDVDYQILEAENLAEALERWQAESPDLVLSDIHLPDGNGLELLEAIKKRHPTQKIPVIMMTGQRDKGLAVQAMELGASDYLIKDDITASTLCHYVETAIAQSNLSGKLTEIQQVNQELQELQSPNYYKYLKEITSKENTWKNGQVGLYNAVIASIPNNPILYECIQEIVKNVKNKSYGYNPLYPTGPGLLGDVYFKNNYEKFVKKIKYFNSSVGTYILNKNQKVLSHYPEYRDEQRKYPPSGPNYYYYDLWNNNTIYIEAKSVSLHMG
jgi:CheY-like chemotaxis protein